MTETKLDNWEEIIDTVIEKTLNKVKEEFILIPKENTLEGYDAKILETLKSFNHPISLDHLAHETGIDKTRLCKKLRVLEKYGKVKCVTKSVTSYWGYV